MAADSPESMESNSGVRIGRPLQDVALLVLRPELEGMNRSERMLVHYSIILVINLAAAASTSLPTL